ncbi:MAG: hypothetical protein JW864_01190 [Spirochaetes bacterium]|nr:hypothetical protein [Spirochaetota bacterium]
MIIFNYLVNEIFSPVKNKWISMFTFFYNNGMKIIYGKFIVLVFAGTLFAQTAEINESVNPESVKENIIAEESSILPEKEGNGTNSVTPDLPETESVQEKKAVTNSLPDKSESRTPEKDSIPEDAEQTEEKSSQQDRAISKPDIKTNGLIDIQDGNFKYSRIHGITLNKTEAEEKTNNIQNKIFTEESEEPVSEEELKEKSIIGMEKGGADIFVKVLLVCLIIGIIILFKFRSKRRNSKVVRRFPGA